MSMIEDVFDFDSPRQWRERVVRVLLEPAKSTVRMPGSLSNSAWISRWERRKGGEGEDGVVTRLLGD